VKVNIRKVEGKIAVETDVSTFINSDVPEITKLIVEKYHKLISLVNQENQHYKQDKKLSHFHNIGSAIIDFRVNLGTDDLAVHNLIISLSEDTGLSDNTLNYMMRFAERFKLSSINDRYSWAFYRELVDIKDDKLRKKVEKESIRTGAYSNHKSVRRIKKEIMNVKE
jgi:hypothetical protein